MIVGLMRLIRGRQGEERAEALLKKRGYRIIERNYRSRYGEIDLVAMDGETIVFVEVKTRTSDAFGSPKCGVDSRKQRHMTLASNAYLIERGISDAYLRFDVVSLEVKNGVWSAEVIKDAFEAME